ncbi:MAG: OsmC family protein [Candidatus Thorarchaeota archaeon]
MNIRTRYPERTEYSADSEWDGRTGGVASTSRGHTIRFDTPATYGGLGEGICPDEMFVCSLLGCLNNTFLDFQRRFELNLISLRLSGKATARFGEGGYRLQGIDVSGEVVVAEGETDVATRCVELMKQYCHISRSIGSCVPITYHIDVREAAPD